MQATPIVMTSKAGNRTAEAAVELEGVCKNYGDFRALSDVDLAVEKGEKIIICGPSGSGKSTLIVVARKQ